MAKLPMFRQDPNDSEGGYLLSMPGLLALVGATAYGADDAVTPQGRANAKYALARILSAARAGGFTQGDVLETMLARGKVTVKAKELAHAAIDAAGTDAVVAIMQSLKP